MDGKRLLELDGMRGIGCVIVLCVHAWPPQLFWGWGLMEMFFVLSGFLITRILLNTDLSALRIRNFLIRRALRIWPVYFFAIVAYLALWTVQSNAVDGPWHDIKFWQLLTFTQFLEGYGATTADFAYQYPSYVLHSWSLAAEEQFYILWPLLILLVGKRVPALLLVCVCFVALGVTLRSEEAAVILLGTRADGFAFGAAMAVLEMWVRDEGGYARAQVNLLYAFMLGAGLSIIAPYIWGGYVGDEVKDFFSLRTYGSWRWNVLGFSMFFFGLIGLMLTNQLRPLRWFLSFRWFTWLGERSYSIYMWQGLAFAGVIWFSYKVPLPTQLGHVIAVIGGVALGVVSYWLVEQRALKFKMRFKVTRSELAGLPEPPPMSSLPPQEPPPATLKSESAAVR